MGALNDRFAFKAVVGFTRKPERSNDVVKELHRIGVTDVYQHWQFPCPYDRILIESHRNASRCMRTTGFFNSTFGHYRVIKTALELGYDSVLVCEDDIRFLSDVSEVDAAAADLPDDFDIALFDAFPPLNKSHDNTYYRTLCDGTAYGRWRRFRNMRSAGCYAMSRRGMDAVVARFDEVPDNPNRRSVTIDQMFDTCKRLPETLNTYFCTPPPARQIELGGCNSGDDGVRRMYALTGADRLEYGG